MYKEDIFSCHCDSNLPIVEVNCIIAIVSSGIGSESL